MRSDMRSDWREARWVVVDIETTGLNPTRDRVLEVAAVVHETGCADTAWYVALDPQVAISPTARSIVGEVAENCAGRPTFAEAADDLLSLLNGAVVVSCGVMEFDWPFITAELERAGREPPTPLPLLLDPLLWTREVGGERCRNLAAACRALGVPEPRSPAPQDACEATLALMLELAPGLPGAPAAILELQDQSRAARESERTAARELRRAASAAAQAEYSTAT